MNLIKGIFHVDDDMEKVYQGYIDKDEKGWNGWLSPYFDFKTAKEIYNDVTMGQTQGYKWSYSEMDKSFLATMIVDGEEEEFDDSQLVVINDLPLYQVGKQYFTWSIKEFLPEGKTKNQKYDIDKNYIQMTFMEDVYSKQDLEEIISDYNKMIYGYVICHWTTDEEEEMDTPENPISPIRFRNVIKKDSLTNDYINSIDFTDTENGLTNEFIGVLYDTNYKEEMPNGAEYTLFIDENLMRVGSWYVGIE